MLIVIVRKGSKFVPVIVREDRNTVEAALSKHAARASGCTAAFVRGTGERSIRELLRADVDGLDSIRALRESFEHVERVTFERRPEFDVGVRKSRSTASVG